MRRLLADLGHPERLLPPVLHVAGTNGKGSTVAFLRAMLEADGRRVHVYTSPHLVRFNERIRLAGTLIATDLLTATLEEVERINAGRPVTFFEVTTAAAFLAFARTPADACLLETGMGGRLDATNLVDRPAATAITPVSFDHMQYLGETIAAIAGEKAGILKPGVPAVIGAQVEEAATVIETRAAALGAPLSRHGREWGVMPVADGFAYRSGRAAWNLPRPGLAGRHQIDNAGLAIATLEAAAIAPVPPEAIARGLAAVYWPARLQRIAAGLLPAHLPHDWELWLDGGHNTACAEVLADWAASLAPGRPLDVVLGMLSTKDPAPFLARLGPHIRRVVAITIPEEKLALPADTLAAAAQAAGIASTTAAGVEPALAALAAGDGPARVLICGSLYLAGKVLREPELMPR